MNSIVYFELVGYNNSPKRGVLTTLYYIDVRITGTTIAQLSDISQNQFNVSYIQKTFVFDR
jgi:hypothetical protein